MREQLTPLGAVLSTLPVDIPIGKILTLASIFDVSNQKKKRNEKKRRKQETKARDETKSEGEKEKLM